MTPVSPRPSQDPGRTLSRDQDTISILGEDSVPLGRFPQSGTLKIPGKVESQRYSVRTFPTTEINSLLTYVYLKNFNYSNNFYLDPTVLQDLKCLWSPPSPLAWNHRVPGSAPRHVSTCVRSRPKVRGGLSVRGGGTGGWRSRSSWVSRGRERNLGPGWGTPCQDLPVGGWGVFFGSCLVQLEEGEDKI